MPIVYNPNPEVDSELRELDGIRVLRSIPAVIRAVFTDQYGLPVEPDPVEATVTVTNSAGEVLVDEEDATSEGGEEGAFWYLLEAEHTAQLDILTVEWTASTGTVYTGVEVVGGFLFSLADARISRRWTTRPAYTDRMLINERTRAEQTIEHACERAFVPRYAMESVNGSACLTSCSPSPISG